MMLRRDIQALCLGHCSDVETRFQPSRLGAALVAMISFASGVWTLLSDDLSSVIIGQSTELPPKFSISAVDWDIFRNTLDFG